MDTAIKMKRKVTTKHTTSINEEKVKEPPKGSDIIEQTINITTEQIENGWLITKSYDGRYKEKDSKDSYGNYFNYQKKWYSKDDPLEINVTDKNLAEAFS